MTRRAADQYIGPRKLVIRYGLDRPGVNVRAEVGDVGLRRVEIVLDGKDRLEQASVPKSVRSRLAEAVCHTPASGKDVYEPQHHMKGMEDPGQNDELSDACSRIERAVALLTQLAIVGRAGQTPSPQSLDTAIALVAGARTQLHGSRPRLTGSGKTRLLYYLQKRENEIVTGEELSRVSGIRDWARRLRELREEGHDIEYIGGGSYRLRPPV